MTPSVPDTTKALTRGAKRKVDQADCEAMVRLYHEHPNEAAFMPWESQLIEATDKEATAPTIRKAMRLYYNYGRYIAAQAKFVRPETRAARIAFAQHYLEAWDLDDWKRGAILGRGSLRLARVRWTHLGLSATGTPVFPWHFTRSP